MMSGRSYVPPQPANRYGRSGTTGIVFVIVIVVLALSNCTNGAPVQEHITITRNTQAKSTSRRTLTSVPQEATQGTAALPSTPSISLAATLSALPPGPSVARSHVVVEAFINAYNDHNSGGMLMLLDDTFQYADCDYVRHIFQIFHSKVELAMWLRDRFAEHAHFGIQELVIANPQGDPPSDPRVIAVGIIRTADTYKRPIHDGFKLILNKAGDRFTTAALSSREVCHQ